MQSAVVDILVPDNEYGYRGDSSSQSSKPAKSSSSGSKKGLGLIPLVLCCCCLIPAIVCAIVALALIPVYLNGPDNNNNVNGANLDAPNLGELVPNGRRAVFGRQAAMMPDLSATNASVSRLFYLFRTRNKSAG